VVVDVELAAPERWWQLALRFRLGVPNAGRGVVARRVVSNSTGILPLP
jgi:hypothetical protein